jgi:hypothetical protein
MDVDKSTPSLEPRRVYTAYEEGHTPLHSDLTTVPVLSNLSLAFHSAYKTVHCVHPDCRTAIRVKNLLGQGTYFRLQQHVQYKGLKMNILPDFCVNFSLLFLR